MFSLNLLTVDLITFLTLVGSQLPALCELDGGDTILYGDDQDSLPVGGAPSSSDRLPIPLGQWILLVSAVHAAATVYRIID